MKSDTQRGHCYQPLTWFLRTGSNERATVIGGEASDCLGVRLGRDDDTGIWLRTPDELAQAIFWLSDLAVDDETETRVIENCSPQFDDESVRDDDGELKRYADGEAVHDATRLVLPAERLKDGRVLLGMTSEPIAALTMGECAALADCLSELLEHWNDTGSPLDLRDPDSAN